MIHLLQPEESYAYSYILDPIEPTLFHPSIGIGHPEIKWSTTMGIYVYKMIFITICVILLIFSMLSIIYQVSLVLIRLKRPRCDY